MKNKIFKSDLEAVKYIVKQSGETSWMLEKKTGISRQQIDRWLKNETRAIRRPTINKLAKNLGYQVTHNNRGVAVSPHTKITEDTNMETSFLKKHIMLQEKEIIRLEHDISRLQKEIQSKKERQTPESVVWNDLTYNFQVEIDLHFAAFGIIGRTIQSVSGIEKQSQMLGYTKDELRAMWDVGTKYKNMKDHPIDKIVHEDSLKEINKSAKKLPLIFKELTNMVGGNYIPYGLIYIHKNGSYVAAWSYNNVSWRNQKVYSKIAFITPNDIE